jgi:hypothetical protein
MEADRAVAERKRAAIVLHCGKAAKQMTAAELKKKLSGSLATGLSIKTLGR